jgi:hypothetical protein
MVAAASSTILTRKEVQGVVKDMSPFVTTFPSQMRTKLIPAFLAVQSELKKSGGSAAEFGQMMTSTMDMANADGQILQAMLGDGRGHAWSYESDAR